MRRRALLTALGASVATAGCVVGYTDSDSSDGNDDTDGEIETLTLAEQGTPPTICSEELKPDGILAIDDPSFGPPTEWPDDPDGYRPLNDQSTVIGVEDGGEARAYPLTILNVHEIVNDTLGRPVIVTYCPICRSGMIAERRIDGETAVFDVSGLLWMPPGIYTAAAKEEDRVFSDRKDGVSNNGNLVMYDDQTGSYWSQMLAQAICGPKAEQRLDVHAGTASTWGEWQSEHPNGDVLLPPPISGTVDPPL